MDDPRIEALAKRLSLLKEETPFRELDAAGQDYMRVQARALLYIADAVAEEAGWRLVPIEPTEAMLKEGGKAVTKHMVLPADVRSAGVARAVAVHEAMLAAAPKIGNDE